MIIDFQVFFCCFSVCFRASDETSPFRGDPFANSGLLGLSWTRRSCLCSFFLGTTYLFWRMMLLFPVFFCLFFLQIVGVHHILHINKHHSTHFFKNNFFLFVVISQNDMLITPDQVKGSQTFMAVPEVAY